MDDFEYFDAHRPRSRLRQGAAKKKPNVQAIADMNKKNDTNEMEERDRDASRIDTQQALEYRPRPKIRLSEIERLLRKHRIIVPPLSRQTLIKMCEEGRFETCGDAPTMVGWLVYEDSFWRWVKSLDEQG